MFRVLNIFLVTVIASTVFDTLADIVETPEMAFEYLGHSLPNMSSFFMSFVTIKAFLGLGFKYLGLSALANQYCYCCSSQI
jgi:hypothetical protein